MKFKPLCRLLSLMVSLVCLWALPSTLSADTSFSFTLPAAATTSAGVYNAQDELVRTLWRAEPYPAGTSNATWDNKDDNGNTVANGPYSIKLIHHNVSYTWEGVIGNTSSSFTGTGVWKSSITARGITDMATDGINLFAIKGYDEGKPPGTLASVADPLTKSGDLIYPPNSKGSHWVGFNFVATDGVRVYFSSALANFDASKTAFVMAVDASNVANRITFANGQLVNLCVRNGEADPVLPVSQTLAYKYTSAIDVSGRVTPSDPTPTVRHSATGLAVQKTGSVLAVAHDTLNAISLFDKITGASLGSIPATGVKRIAFAPNGDLWGIYTSGSSTVVSRWTGVGTTNTLATTLSGLSAPIAVAVHPSNNDIVYVADGGTSQQIKAFNSSGASLWTSGIAGGYQTGAAALSTVVDPASPSTARFDFRFGTYIVPYADGSIWIADSGNYRNIHFKPQPGAPAPVVIRQLMWKSFYNVACDPNQPQRLFNDWLEFQVDYTKTLTPGDPSATGGNLCWKLVRNWQRVLPAGALDAGTGAGFNDVTKLSNNRTYCLLPTTPGGSYIVAEMESTGKLRATGTILSGGKRLYPNGELRYATIAAGVETVYKQVLTSFDASGNPVWAAPTVIASHPWTEATEPNGAGEYGRTFFPTTSTGVTLVFDGQGGTLESDFPNHSKFRLGGLKPAATAFSWKASPTVLKDIPCDKKGSFPFLASAGHVAGISVWAFDRNVLYGYNGNSGNVGGGDNQYKHFWDNGLFIGQFGVMAKENPGDTAVAGHAHNILSMCQVKVAGVPYVYTSDEGSHAGIHRWKITNLASIQEILLNVNAGPGGLVNGATYEIEALCAPGKRLSVVGGGTTAGTLVQSITDANTTAQRWTAEEQGVGTGIFELIPTNAPAMRLSVAAGASANGTTAQIDADNNSSYQRWRAELQSNGAYELIPQHATSQRLDVNAGSSSSGAKVQLWGDNNTVSQRWNLLAP